MAMVRSHLLLPSACLLLSFVACDRPSKPVARIGEGWIDQLQWKQYVAEAPAGTLPAQSLDQLIRREVAWEQAEKTGLLKTTGWQQVGPKLRRAVINRFYLESLPGKPAPTEQEVKGFFLSHGEERHVMHLVCKTEADAQGALKRLKRGEPFERVATAVSVDPSAAKNHGDIGWIKREAAVAEFSRAVFAATPGEWVGPFQSQFGWHVAVVKDRRPPTEVDFEKQKGRLMAEAVELANAPKRERAIQTLRGTYPLKVDMAVLGITPTPASAMEDGKRIAGEVAGTKVTLKELEAFIMESFGPGGPDHAMGAAIRRRFLESYADELRLCAAAEKAGIPKKADVKAALWQVQRQSVYQAFSRTYLRGLNPTDAQLAVHLKEHSDRFRQVGAVKLQLLVANDQAAAEAAAQEATQGAPWKKLVQRFGNAESTGQWDPGFLEVAALKKLLPPEAVKALIAKPVGSVVGPVLGPEGPMVFKVLDRRSGEAMPLDQCRDAVKEDYLKTRGSELVEQYLDGEGRKGLRIQVFPENITL